MILTNTERGPITGGELFKTLSEMAVKDEIRQRIRGIKEEIRAENSTLFDAHIAIAECWMQIMQTLKSNALIAVRSLK